MSKIRKITRLVICAMFVLVISSLIVPSLAVNAADENKPESHIQISPTGNRQKLEPGQKFTGSFNVNNIGSEAFDFRVYVKPFSIGDDCVDKYEVSNDFNQMSAWVNFDQNNYYNLKPDQTQKITFYIDVPKNAPSGHQYIAIFAETGSFDPASGNAIKVNKRIGYKFYADLGGQDNQAGKIESVKQGSLFLNPPINSTSKVRNTGNVDFTEEHTYTITGLGGQEVYSSTSKEDVLPDTCRIIKAKWDKTPAFGIFWVENKIEFLGQEQFNQKKLVIVIPIYVVLIFGIMIALLIWALVLKVKGDKNIKKVHRKAK
jgi:hypothetical protein